MDTLNKTILEQEHLTYKYRGDPNIQIGVMGMVDDNLSVSNCGMGTVQKIAVINSFIETQRLTLSQTKSVVIHVGKSSKCKKPCPTLKVHDHIMKTVQSQRYLGDIISATGSQTKGRLSRIAETAAGANSRKLPEFCQNYHKLGKWRLA